MRRVITRGSNALKSAPGSSADKGRQLGLSKDAVNAYIRGDREPSKATQQLCLQLWGIEPEWWQEELVAPLEPAAPRAPAVPGSATPEAIADLADEMMADVADARAAAALMLDPAERIRALDQAAKIVATLARIRGTLQSERQVRENPHFRRIHARLVAAVADNEEALRAIAAACDAEEQA